ncbi:ABC transporter ATP-binding protein [Levilactobacillus brevis]|uniref:ABC transporter ATP-binding protein n=1 Tax=Levilactobacillus brevis TaxID=1580 RepID=UPI001BA607D8|nr:ABC transporter ATP-binding protein [Levilactobacillus brevis]MBS1006663.1 ABC transporter ATP-binding protein [Levilactobacillus brevis]MBS1013745.1 ABC transporter ATP-binding protein [Levilactobacillus brevis]
MTTTAIQVQHLAKHFKTTSALRDLSFTVHQGEIFGFLGPSGAGKTTTLKILTGQLAPSAGTATVLGHDVTQLTPAIYEHVGIVTHNSGLYDRLSVTANLRFFAKLLGVATTKVTPLLARVGLSEQQHQLAGKLSQGQRKRLILARAVLHAPAVLFLDEPTSGLDPSTALAIHHLIRDLRDQGTAIFLTTHNMTEATKLCDQVALLNDGQIVELGTPQALRLKYNRHQNYRVLFQGETTAQTLSGPAGQTIIAREITAGHIVTIHSGEPTLEDVFLEVTGRNLE